MTRARSACGNVPVSVRSACRACPTPDHVNTILPVSEPTFFSGTSRSSAGSGPTSAGTHREHNVLVRLGGQGHAAPLRCRVEPGLHVAAAELLEQRGDQVQVHAAYQGGVLAGQRVERAVRQHHPVALDAWFVAVRGEHRGDAVESGSVAGCGGGAFVSRALGGTEAMPGVGGRALHRLENRDPVAGGVLDGSGQDLPGAPRSRNG
jgi:hypothetical protein